MIIPCPHCQVKLNLPEDVEGKQVRCPSCRTVFRADKDVLDEAIQPETAPAAVTPRPRVDDDEDERVARKPKPRYDGYDDEDEDAARKPNRRDGGYDDDEDDRGRDRDDGGERDIENDRTEIMASAKRVARPAGLAMAGACLFTTINIVGNAILSMMAQQQVGPPPGGPDAGTMMAFMVICVVIIFGPMLIFIGLGAKSLFGLGARGLIVTAIVMNFIFLLILGAGLALNIVALADGNLPIPLSMVLPTVVMNSISCVLNLAAAVLAIRVLMNGDVSEAYVRLREDISRRRRY